jgi:hypothetical protein
VIDRLKARGAAFRSLHDPIDTSSPQGEFTFHILGAVAQLERSLIAERTRAGLRTARARGRRGGNPGLRAGDPAAVRKAAAARDEVYLKGLLASADDWLPTVRRLRPQLPWGDVARVLTGRNGATWTPERLRRSVRRLVSEGLAEADLLARTPVRPANDRLAVLVAGIVGANPSMSLRAIAAQLEGLHERAPRGGDRWSASSVQLVLDRARRQGLLEAEA